MKKKAISVILITVLCVSLFVPTSAAELKTIPGITINFATPERQNMPDIDITLTNFFGTFEMIGGVTIMLATADTSSTVSFNRDMEINYGPRSDIQTKAIKAGEIIKISDYCNEIPASGFDPTFWIDEPYEDDSDHKLVVWSITFFVGDASFASQYFSDESDFSRMGILYQLEDFAIDITKVPVSVITPPPGIHTLLGKPTSSTVLVNGKNIAFDAYNINGNNYFKLRDLAFVLSGTDKQFEVGWDDANNAISLTNGKAYTVVGGEMTGKGDGDKTTAPTGSKIYLDGEEVQFTAYNIESNNYFKLRDIGAALNFGVDWDDANNTIIIDTSKGYTPE